MSSPSPATVYRPSSDRCPGFLTSLILRCAAREELALGSLFDHLHPVVSAIVGRGTPSGAADALTVATFRHVWEQAPSYDPNLEGPVAWTLSKAWAVRAAYLQAAAPPSEGTARRHRLEAPWIAWEASAIVSPR